ncbi:protein neuralized isoform X2 [Planococcus citri]|uniref:protein neuralized isoform X2 n=1 Tax=Planococcus citri TaxID=170843 RepID=UPI0031F7741F
MYNYLQTLLPNGLKSNWEPRIVGETLGILISKSKSRSNGLCHPLPLKFHSTKGKNIRLEKDETVAVRENSFCNGLTFTSRPVMIEEKVYIKLVEKCDDWSGVIRFGFTNVDPATLKDLPKYACPDLTDRVGFWAKAVNEKYAEKDAILYFYVTKSGVVHYGINERSKEVFFTGVDTSNKLWAMIDVYGNSKTIELVNHKLNNMTPDQEAGFDLCHLKRNTDAICYQGLESGMESLTVHEKPEVINQYRHQDNVTYRPSTSNIREDPHRLSKNCARTSNRDHVKVHQSLKLDPLQFHDTHGIGTRLSNDRFIASRIENFSSFGYVFSSPPIKKDEFLIVQILETNTSFAGCLTIGATSVDPAKISPHRLPENSDNLIDTIGGHSVTHKNVGISLMKGDELIFSVSRNGDVTMKKNKDRQVRIFCIDNTIPFWWLFDVVGSTTKIRAFTGVLVDNNRPVSSCTIAQRPVSSTPSWPNSTIDTIAASPAHSSSALVPSAGPDQAVRNVPVMLVVKCCDKPDVGCSMEPMNIIFQNHHSGVQNEIGINVGSSDLIISAQTSHHHRLPTPQMVADYANVRPIKQREFVADTSVADNGRNREHCLHEWAKTKTRGYSSNPRISECTVCYEKPVDAVLYSCGHMCMCFSCALELWRGKGDGHCPICRAVIKDVIRTYKS